MIFSARPSMWLALPLTLVSLGCDAGHEESVTAFTEGHIYTLDAANTEVEVMVIQGGEIVYTGTRAGAQSWWDEGLVEVKLAGHTLLPGFHDAHTHLIWSAADLLNVDLYSATTVEELQAAVLEWADNNPSAEWIQGGGWDMSIFDGQLHKSQLDAVVPDRPTSLYAADGHSSFVNSLALSMAGITKNTPDPEDGRIERDQNGEPTGILRESAMTLVDELMPLMPDSQVDQGLVMGMAEANAYGITTIIDASVDDWMLAGYRRAEDVGQLTLRVHGAVEVLPGDPENLSYIESLRDEFGSDRVMVDAGKFYIDGIIESQTAAMLEPYEDGTNGLANFTDPELLAAARELDQAGFQLHAHAIGDGAVRQFLDAVEGVISSNGARDRRPLVAHLEVIDPTDIPRFVEVGALANFQPLWAYPDSYIVDLTWPVIGEARSEWLYPIGAVVQTGASVVAGSDWSVSSMNPFEAIEVAVTRQDPWEDAGPILTPQHQVDVLTAIRAYTSEGARASFSENELGTLDVGKRADFIIVDRNPFTLDPYGLSDVVVLETWLEGGRVFTWGESEVRQSPRRRPHREVCGHR